MQFWSRGNHCSNTQCYSQTSILPFYSKKSMTKLLRNIDASLLPTISWPAFAIHEDLVRNRTLDKVIRKLRGKYGIKRFFRDGYKTVVEDRNRKYYRPAEIKNFDGIESEWPMFFVNLLIDSFFRNNKEDQMYYQQLVDSLLHNSPDGQLLPMYYYVPKESVEREKASPGSQQKRPSAEGTTGGIFMWGQSLLFISKLLGEGLLGINDLDVIRRHLPATERPSFSNRYSKFQGTAPDLVIQIVLISETNRLQQLLGTYGIETQTPHQIEPIQIWSPKELTKAYEYLGVNNKLGITGRPGRPFGVLSTSKIFRACGKTVLCYPLLFEMSDFYLAQDISLVMDDCKTFISSAAVEHLDFLNRLPDSNIFTPFEEKTMKASFKSLTEIPQLVALEEEPFASEANLRTKPSQDLVNFLLSVSGLNAQVTLLKILYEREGPFFSIEGGTISERLELLIHRAGAYKNWWAVRMCSALLGKLVDSLAPSITTMLVRGKQMTVGVFGHEESVLDKPISPNELKNILYSKCLPFDVCQAVLQQEIILSIGKLIATSPELFDGILKIRIGTPFQKRQLDGALNRVPKDFYDKVWEILEKTPGGIKVAGFLLPQQPTQSDMTMYELNFSLLVEEMLSKISDPSYRQLMVEAFMVVSTILERNPELMFHQSANMDKIIQEAYDDFQQDLNRMEGREKQDDMHRFYNTPANVRYGTTAYIAKAVIKNLLDGDLRVVSEDMCSIS
ncbi:phosphorylase b kinase regulatory subunit beta [Elysia marginata]|uniref:Phosphorylase b kinase regulatory subunit n=1 Tax=Elysia marginata TaxID=1093978 RepID=A0AAV4GEN3_9GAST|nr:phosphorylase b kinase regulatory subunit beta [Elysia marginata]